MTEPEPPQLRKYDTDVELPLFYLLDHIQDVDGQGGTKSKQKRSKDVKMYLAQKDIKNVLPQLVAEVAPLPLQVCQ